MQESRNLKTFVSKFIEERAVEKYPHLYIVGESIVTQTRKLGPIEVYRKPLIPHNPNPSLKSRKDSTNRIW